MRDYQVGDTVIYKDKKISDLWKRNKGISLYNKIAKIIKIDIAFTGYLLEFKEYIMSPLSKGKNGHCKWCYNNKFELAIDHLKFKKWVKG